jgi:hypothetical protein
MNINNIAEAAYFQVVALWYAIMPESRARPSLLRKVSPITPRSRATIEGALDHLLEIVEYAHGNPQLFP